MPAANRDDARVVTSVASSALTLVADVPRGTEPAEEPAEELAGLLRRAAAGELDAAAAVFEATVHDAWRVALLAAGSADGATAVLELAYQRIWAEAGGHGAAVSRDVVPAPLTRAWVLALVYRVAREQTPLAPSA